MTDTFIKRMMILGFIFILLVISFTSCNTPITENIEANHDKRDIEIAKEKTKSEVEKTQQLKYIWKIDSLKACGK